MTETYIVKRWVYPILPVGKEPEGGWVTAEIFQDKEKAKAFRKTLGGQGTKIITVNEQEILRNYSKTWEWLEDYDSGIVVGYSMGEPPMNKNESIDIVGLAQMLKKELALRDPFGEVRDAGAIDSIGNFYGCRLETAQERAAWIFYEILKRHPFRDGNKRTAAYALVIYLQKQGIEHKINADCLAALAILVASSDADCRDIMLELTMKTISHEYSRGC